MFFRHNYYRYHYSLLPPNYFLYLRFILYPLSNMPVVTRSQSKIYSLRSKSNEFAVEKDRYGSFSEQRVITGQSSRNQLIESYNKINGLFREFYGLVNVEKKMVSITNIYQTVIDEFLPFLNKKLANTIFNKSFELEKQFYEQKGATEADPTIRANYINVLRAFRDALSVEPKQEPTRHSRRNVKRVDYTVFY